MFGQMGKAWAGLEVSPEIYQVVDARGIGSISYREFSGECVHNQGKAVGRADRGEESMEWRANQNRRIRYTRSERKK